MKNCEYYEELIGAALDGEITAEEEKELRAHLESCEACRNFYEAMQAISGADDALGEPPENFTANVMARVHEAAAPAKTPEETPAKKKTNITRLVTRYGALAAAAAVAIWAGVTFGGAFAAKSADSSSSTAPEVAMYSAAGDDAETEKAVRDAAPAEAPAGGMMMAAAPESAAANEEDSSVTVTVAAAKDEAGETLTLSDDGFFAGYLLLDEGETAAPARNGDYALTLTAPDGTESEYRLWVGKESVIWQKADEDAAHLSPASPEALNEVLHNASR